MKKNKIIKVLLFIIGLFALSGCTTKFCTSEDIMAITNGIKTQLDNNTYSEGDYARPDSSKLSSALSTVKSTYDKEKSKKESKWTLPAELHNLIAADYDAITIANYNETEQTTYPDVWDYVGTLTASESIKTVYAYNVYSTAHPKACLTFEDHEDKYSGGTISSKDFGYAFKTGLFEIIAWPISWLFIQGANILGGGQMNGITICFSIIIVTFIIRGIILALTFKSSKQSQQMQAIQPEMEAINNKYAGRTDEQSKQAKSMEMMNIYKKHGINPMSSLITPFITLPIFVAVYSAVKDTTVIFEQTIAGVCLGDKMSSLLTSFNWFAILIFVLMTVCQFLTMKLPQWLAKKNIPAYKRKEQKKQAGMGQGQMTTYIMLGMIVIFSWMLPLAMSIYWLTSSLFGIFQTLLMDYLKKKDSGKEEKIDISKKLGA